jgi:tetratricopeptide (TPR) repeat protein
VTSDKAPQSYKSNRRDPGPARLAILICLVTSLLHGPQARANEKEEMGEAVDFARKVAKISRDKVLRDKTVMDENAIKQAKAIEKTGTADGAIKYLQNENDKNNSALICITIGRYYQDLDRDDQALAAYSKAIQLGPPTSQQSVYGLVALELRATLYEEREELEKAIADYSEAIKITKSKYRELLNVNGDEAHFYEIQELHAWQMRTVMYLALRDTEKALAGADVLMHKYPFLSDGYQSKANALQSIGRHEEAIALMKQAVAHGANPRLLSDMQMHASGGDFQKGYETLTQAIKTSKDPNRAKQLRAEYARKNNHPAQALRDYQDLLKAAPDDDSLLVGRGYTYLDLLQYRQAIQDFS